MATKLAVGRSVRLKTLDAWSLRAPVSALRKLRFTAWLFQVRWFRAAVIAFWIGAGYGCQALWRAMSS